MGLFIYDTGEIYEGWFKNTKSDGKGRMMFGGNNLGDYYEGDYLNNNKHG